MSNIERITAQTDGSRGDDALRLTHRQNVLLPWIPIEKVDDVPAEPLPAMVGEVVIRKVPNWELDSTLLRIFDLYEHHHDDGESFRAFAARTEPAWWTQALAPVEDPV
jgi:sulfite reductase beta subunit-like hemoprotein